MAGRMSLQLFVVWEVFCALFHMINEKLCNTPPRCSNRTESTGHPIPHDIMVRKFEASDREGEGHGRQEETSIDCCVGEIFCLILRKCRTVSHLPPPTRNENIEANHRITKDAARGFDVSDRAREGHGRRQWR
jgi:hypothetical protein